MTAIYLLGDSHTAAIGPRLKKLFPGATYRFESFSGYSTARAHAAANIAKNQDLVVLSLGGNDFGDRAKERTALIKTVWDKNPKAWILWFGPFQALGDTGSRHNLQAESQAKQMPELRVVWVDTRAWANNKHSADNVHFTGAGYDEIASKMKPRMDELLGLAAPVRPYEPEPVSSVNWGLLLAVVGAAGAWWLLRRT